MRRFCVYGASALAPLIPKECPAMHIENTIRLDFKDVLIRPKRSTLTSRSEVDITREFKFRHSPLKYHAIPIIAANMDTTGTFEMARALGRHGMSTALCKHYSVDEYVDFFTSLEEKHTAFYSLGISDADWEKFLAVEKKAPKGAISTSASTSPTATPKPSSLS